MDDSRGSATPQARFSIWMWAMIGIIYGVAVCLGGPERWSSAVYGTVSRVPGSPYVWGVIIATAGALTITGSLRLNMQLRDVGLWLYAAWLFFFGTGIAISASTNRAVAYAGTVLLFGIAVQLLVFWRMDERIGRASTRSG